jgi:hypothetical protein
LECHGRGVDHRLREDPENDRTYIRLLFTDLAMRELYADREEVTRLAIAQLRMHNARNPGDPQLAELVRELSAQHPEFRQWWAEHDVASRGTGTKHLRHRVVGDLILNWNTLACATDPEQHIIVWTAQPGTPTYDGLRLLASWITDQNRSARSTMA